MLGHDVMLLQVTSHRHDAAQSIDGQACGPEQVMSQGAGPQLMFWHADALEQSMSQLLATAQSIAPHEFGLLHLIVQSKPAGHCTLPHS